MHGQWEGGKGSATRQKFNKKRYDMGYDRAYGKDRTVPNQGVFEGFPKIYRLFRDIIITEKIDGTNAQVLITEDGQIFPGSRKRWITPDADNFGFAVWVQEHTDELLQLGPGRHFGEWWGRGIQRGYGLDERRFSLFNVSRWQSPRLMVEYPVEDLLPERTLAPRCCHVVPILWAYKTFDTYGIQGVIHQLRCKGSAAAPGFMDPEGIVVFHTQSNHLYKTTFENDGEGKSNG